MRGNIYSLCLLFFGLSISSLFAQSITDTGEIYGRVVDEEQQPLPGVIATLESNQKTTQSTETTVNGSYRFLNLPPGTYEAKFSLSGFSEIQQHEIRITVGAHLEFDVTMTRSLQETITVPAGPSMLDRKKMGNSTVYTKEFLELVPNGRDPWFLIAMTAGIDSSRLNTGTGSIMQAMVFSRGDQFLNTTWNQDGLDQTDPGAPGAPPMYYDFEAFEEIEIKTGGNDVSMQTGGIAINLVTKRAGNTWSGQGSLYRSGELKDYGFQTGGPFVKDKLFAWGGYRFVDDHSLEQLFIRTKSTLENLNAKVNLNWNGDHSTDFGYVYGSKHVENRDFYGGASTLDARAEQYAHPKGIFSLEHTWIPNHQTLISARYGFNGENFGFDANGGTDKPMIWLISPNSFENTTYTADIKRNSHSVNLDGNYFREKFIGADHEFRFGFEYKTANLHTFSTYGNGVFIYDYYQTTINGPLTAGSLAAQHQLNIHQSRQNAAAYVSDIVRKNRLTMNLGIRFDYQTGQNQPSDVRAVPGYEQSVGAFHYPGGNPDIATKNFSPRLGLTYALTRDNKTLLRSNFARYYDAFNPEFLTHSNPTAIYNGARFVYVNKNADRNITPDEIIDGPFNYGGNNNGTFDLAAFEAQRLYDSNLTNAWTNEFLIGVERELANNFSIGATFNYRRYGEFLKILPYGVTSADYVPGGVFTADTEFGNFSVPYYVLSYYHDGTAILKNIHNYEESYRGIDFILQKRMSHNFLLNGSLTLQRQLGHYQGGDSLAFQTDRTAGDGATYPFDPTNLPFLNNQPYSYASAGGGINPTTDWSIKTSGVYLFPFDISVGAFVRYQQGYPMVLFGRVRDDTLSAFYRSHQHLILLEPIGSRRYPNVFTTDFQIQKTFNFGRAGKITGMLTVFNLFNRQPLINGPTRIDDGANFPRGPRPASLDARSYRWGVRYGF